MYRVIIQLGDRKVYWELDANAVAGIAQTMIATFGPAHGEVEDDG